MRIIMLSDGRTIEAGATVESDVCIIGGGAAGITTALELRETGLRVVLLESGDIEFDDDTQALAEGDIVGDPLLVLDGEVALDETRLRFLGGTTNHWAGYCRPLEEIDFEPRDHLPVSGWPIDRSDLEPWWARSAQWCRISNSDFDPYRWAEAADLPAPVLDTERVNPVAFQVAFPMPFGQQYLAELSDADDVEVILWANAVNLATTTGATIDGVDVRTLSGNQFSVQARAYVLASGGIENPRLLLASRDADPNGIGNDNDLVGAYFTEHLQVYAGFGVLDVEPADLAGFVGTDIAIPDGIHAGVDHGVKFGLALTADHVREAATQGLEIQFAIGSFPAGVPLQEEGLTAADVGGAMAAAGSEPASTIYLQALGEQRLNIDSRVRLGTELDAVGLPRVELDWRHGIEDRQAILSGLRVMAEEFGATGLGRLQLIPGGLHADAVDNLDPTEILTLYRVAIDEVDDATFPIGVGFHHMCTTRMAENPQEGVVDANCKVHGVDNLWIGGSSVFATGGVATPTFTIVALASRLADHLKQQLTSAAFE